MAETIQKLQPNRDLQCYFFMPSAIAALSSTSETGFTVSGTWRQQFDWAVIEWNRDNTFEHPLFRNLPDGDLSELTLTYQESRSNCISLDSNLYPTVAWPYLRFWLDGPDGDVFREVRLADYASPAAGQYGAASALFSLTGTATAGDLIELEWDASEHYNYTIADGDTNGSAIIQLASIINSISTTVSASATGSTILLTRLDATEGINANAIGVYGTVSGSQTEVWQPVSQTFSGGTSPATWQVTIPFASLTDILTNETFSATNVRKMRWTYSAAIQTASYQRSEFEVSVTNWSVAGNNRAYSVAGPGSRRIEDDSTTVAYAGTWSPSSANKGNFSGGSIAYTTATGSSLSCMYTEPAVHSLYLGTRQAPGCGTVQITIDGGAPSSFNCYLSDDELVRVSLGNLAAGNHTIDVLYTGANGYYFYFDFLEIAYPTNDLPDQPAIANVTLATDWDTEHSLALAPERTAWLISKLGFQGRANHYQGALWFFELTRLGQVYATATITFGGISALSAQTIVNIDDTDFTHLHLQGDDTVTVPIALALQINNGSTGVWAGAGENVLTITSRLMGTAGNATTLAVKVLEDPNDLSTFTATASGPSLAGGVDGTPGGVAFQDVAANVGWRTDLSASPPLNRAARDWSQAFFEALTGYGIQATTAFSTELQFADPSTQVGVAQRYSNGRPCVVNTPAIQTNFSTASLSFWQSVHLCMAQTMAAGGQTPYLQFGEVQWWYFPGEELTSPPSEPSMPFYDAYTQQQYQSAYGTALPLIATNTVDPTTVPQAAVLLPSLIGQFTSSIMAYVRQSVGNAQFEVLYPPDVNDYALTQVINLPVFAWTAQTLNCFKTENFTFTGNRNLDQALNSIGVPLALSFPADQTAHLVGIGDYTTPWEKEAGLAVGAGVESVVLFALDQFCLIGYPTDFYPNIQSGSSMA
jgi:hypothetical protein